MSHRSRLAIAALLVTSSALTAPVLAQVTTRTPIQPITPIPDKVALPTGPAVSPTSGILHSGSYRLKIHVLPGGDAPNDIQKETDVAVVVSGTSVTINGTSPSTGTAALNGTIASNQFTATGSDGPMHISIAGTGTASGVAGTLTVGSGSRTAHGTFNLRAMPPSQLHAIAEYGTKPPPPPTQGGGFWGWWDSLFNW